MPPTRSQVQQSFTALLIIDVINPLDFPGGQAFATKARRAVRVAARLAERCRQAGVPVIFVNDNFGRWRSDIDSLIEQVVGSRAPGASLPQVLRPNATDFVVLKSTLSGFHQTPLEAMLRLGHVRRVILSGFLTGNCVLFTAADAYMRDFNVLVASDAVADLTGNEHRAALRKMAQATKARIQRAADIRPRRR